MYVLKDRKFMSNFWIKFIIFPSFTYITRVMNLMEKINVPGLKVFFFQKKKVKLHDFFQI